MALWGWGFNVGIWGDTSVQSTHSKAKTFVWGSLTSVFGSLFFLRRLVSFPCLKCFIQALLPNLFPPNSPSCQIFFSQLRDVMIIWRRTLIPDSTTLLFNRKGCFFFNLDYSGCFILHLFNCHIPRLLQGNEIMKSPFWHYTNHILSLIAF